MPEPRRRQHRTTNPRRHRSLTTPDTGTHNCPCSCGRQVPEHLFACRDGWYRLPMDLRSPISANYRRDPTAHREAMADACRWYRENPRPGVAR